jgi:hypothetical protein
MTPIETLQAYREAMEIAGEDVIVRRFTGIGVGRPQADTTTRARVTGYQDNELVSTIQQGDRKVIMLVENLIVAGFAVPVTPKDKIVVRGRTLSIESVDDSTRRVQGELIAYEIQARG